MEESSKKEVARIYAILQQADADLAGVIFDECDAAEERGEFSAGFFTGDNDDIPVIVPEDAAPEIDEARSHVQAAVDAMMPVAEPEKWAQISKALTSP